jgi:large conductance mechanosensitive channel
MWNEFKTFALKGNVVDMAVGIIIGAAFGTVVNSLVKDVIMPPIGLLLGKVDFSNLFLVLKDGLTPGPFASLAEAQKAGAVAVAYGQFINNVLSFLIVAWAVFILIKGVNRLRSQFIPQPEANTRDCPFCLSKVPRKAIKCAHCASTLEPV